MSEPLTLQQILALNIKLPSSPQVLVRLMETLNQENAQSDEIVDIVSGDPMLMLEVIRVANSPLYGASRQIRSVTDALMRIGLNEVWSITSALKTKELFTASSAAWTPLNARLWEHSLKAAAAARSLSAVLNPRATEVFFTAGMLHDCGKLLLLRARADYAKLCKNDDIWGDALTLREREAFGSDHAKLGGELLEHWKLPGHMAKLISEHHHLPVESSAPNAVALLRLADQIARHVPVPMTDDISLPTAAVTDAGLSAEMLSPILENYQKNYRKLEAI
jgi:putative nucleotidyltransferase with HDIG domain